MSTALEAFATSLEAAVAAALRAQLMTNRGTFAPFRVAPVTAEIVCALVAGDPDAAASLGRSLGREGLSLTSLTAAQTAALEVVARQATPDILAELAVTTSQSFSSLLAGLSAAEIENIQRQRDEIERAFRQVVAEQQEQEHHLRDAIRELSTPIIPVHEGVLVLPLVGAVDSRRATEITERLLEAIAAHQADLVILDITGVSLIDTSTANHLLMTTRAAALLGSQVVLTGMGPEVAQSVVHLGVDLRGLVTLASLRDGLDYALGQLGLGIRPLDDRGPAPKGRSLLSIAGV
jgi:rsbT co-antagonist protein RsbR